MKDVYIKYDGMVRVQVIVMENRKLKSICKCKKKIKTMLVKWRMKGW